MIEELVGYEIDVYRNDKITLDEVGEYDILFLSPGPGVPKDAGILIDVIKRYSGEKPMFGVCLGLQAMAEAFGGELTNLDRVYHGVATDVACLVNNEPLFNEIPKVFEAGRYHSWVATADQLPNVFEVTAEDVKEHEIMAIRHKNHLTKAVQFHPESVLTPQGKTILRNFLKEAGAL